MLLSLTEGSFAVNNSVGLEHEHVFGKDAFFMLLSVGYINSTLQIYLHPFNVSAFCQATTTHFTSY